MISKLFRPREIIVTDQESHMDLIRQNLEYNEVLNSCKAHTFDWKTFDRSNPIKYDVILALEW